MSLNFPDEPNDGDIFEGYVYNATRNVWDVKLPSDNNIEDLNNVNLTSPANGQALVYNTTSSNWVNQNQTFSGLTDTSFASPVTGDSLVYNGTNWVNGPRSGNAIINGDFGIWQRGTSFSNPVSGAYTSDRWSINYNGSGATRTVSRELFTPSEITATGYGDPQFYFRYNQSVAGSGATFGNIVHKIEDVRTFSNQTLTVSFWARASANTTRSVIIGQIFGSGGSDNVFSTMGTVSITTSWQRYSLTAFVPTISGKTIGTSSTIDFNVSTPLNSTFTIDLWGFQVESGPAATPFQLAGGGSKGAELALCQRYYFSSGPDGGLIFRTYNHRTSAGFVNIPYQLPVSMRTSPSVSATVDVTDGTPTNAAEAFSTNTRDIFIQQSIASGAFLDLRTVVAQAEL